MSSCQVLQQYEDPRSPPPVIEAFGSSSTTILRHPPGYIVAGRGEMAKPDRCYRTNLVGLASPSAADFSRCDVSKVPMRERLGYTVELDGEESGMCLEINRREPYLCHPVTGLTLGPSQHQQGAGEFAAQQESRPVVFPDRCLGFL